MRNHSLIKYGLAFGLSVLTTTAFAVDPCTATMGHVGGGQSVSGNRIGSISGTPWGYEQWYQGGSNASMTYYSNGTFKANWSGISDYLARVGFQYGDGGSGVDHKTKKYGVDYKYTKTGTASYGYIGIYGWTAQAKVEYYIVDDWFSKPNEQYIGKTFGTLTVDGGTYSIHAYLRQNEPSKSGTSTFVQFFSVRDTPRQCGHIDVSAHFNKWDELFHGQTEQLSGSKGGASATVKLNNLTEMMLMTEAGGNASGSVDYTYFNMVDNATATVKPIENNPHIASGKFNVQANQGIQVFDMQGKFVGVVSAGTSTLAEAISAKFHTTGIFFAKNCNVMQKMLVHE